MFFNIVLILIDYGVGKYNSFLLIKGEVGGSTMRFTNEMSEADAIVLVERLTHQVIAGEINPDRYTSALVFFALSFA